MMSHLPGALIRATAVALAAGVLLSFSAATESAGQAPIKLAVFDFELDDASPAAALNHLNTTDASSMEKVSMAARAELANSGRYSLIDTHKADAKPLTDKMLHDCDGCDAQIASQLGADQSLIGVVRRATQTDYYIVIQIRDARSGKLLDQQSANFAGGEEGWPTGVRMLIKHQILAGAN